MPKKRRPVAETPTPVTGYSAPILDANGRATFSDYLWNLYRDTSKAYAIEQATGIVPQQFRFEVRVGDTWSGDAGATNPRNRAEFGAAGTAGKIPFGEEVWFSYAMRIKSGLPTTAAYAILGQFHDTTDEGDGGGGGISPPFAINLVQGEKLKFIKRYNTSPLGGTPVQTLMHERSVVRDRWYRIVGRIVFDWTPNGAVDLWFDGSPIVTLTNAQIGYNDTIGPYWKFGIYRAEAPETLVVEYANMELGSASLLARVASPLPILT